MTVDAIPEPAFRPVLATSRDDDLVRRRFVELGGASAPTERLQRAVHIAQRGYELLIGLEEGVCSDLAVNRFHKVGAGRNEQEHARGKDQALRDESVGRHEYTLRACWSFSKGSALISHSSIRG